MSAANKIVSQSPFLSVAAPSVFESNVSTKQPNLSNSGTVQPFPKAKHPDDGQPPHHNGGETAIAPSRDEHRPKKSESWISWKVVAPLVGGATFYFAYLVGVTFLELPL